MKLLKALQLQYKAEIAICEANLAVYMNNTVGVAEHPNVTESMDEIITRLTGAKEKLQEVSLQLKERGEQ